MGTWIVGTVVLLAVCLAGYKLYRDRKTGKGCGGSCDGCGGCGKRG